MKKRMRIVSVAVLCVMLLALFTASMGNGRRLPHHCDGKETCPICQEVPREMHLFYAGLAVLVVVPFFMEKKVQQVSKEEDKFFSTLVGRKVRLND